MNTEYVCHFIHVTILSTCAIFHVTILSISKRQVSDTGDDRKYNEIEVVVWGAKHLPKKDRFGSCDAYVNVELISSESEKSMCACMCAKFA